MYRFVLLPVIALAACSLEADPADAVAIAPTSEMAELPAEAPAALSRRVTSPQRSINHIWGGSFVGERGDVPREQNLERTAATIMRPEFLCSRTVDPDGESIVALNISYSDLREAGETCWARVVSGDIGEWLELAAVTDSSESRTWTRATTRLPETGTLVGLSGRTTVTASYASDNGPALTLQGWSLEAEPLWTRTLSKHSGWPRWSPTGVLMIETQGADFAAGLTVLDPATGDVVATRRLDARLQRIVNDPWALVRNSRTTVWSSELWPANAEGDIVSNGFRVEHDTAFYLKYDVYDVETGDRVWGKSINPGKHTRTLFVDVEGPWLLVSVVSGAIARSDWDRSQADGGRSEPPLGRMKKQADGIEVRAYDLATGKAVGTWNYELSSNYRQP